MATSMIPPKTATASTSATPEDSSDVSGTRNPTTRFELAVPGRMVAMTGVAMVAGMAVGGRRGARMAGMRFLAENAHRPPRTIRGWYLYSKTKNYRMILAGLQGAGREAVRLGFIAFGWATIEEGLERVGWGEVKEVGAGLGAAALFTGVYRLPMRTMYQAGILGLMAGTTMRGLRWVQERTKPETRKEESE